jgi:hypothetical protein
LKASGPQPVTPAGEARVVAAFSPGAPGSALT